MSDKPFKKLNPLDQALRRCFPTRMTNGTEINVVIKMQIGFELYNTRPYHNYENWSDGYVVEDGEGNFLLTHNQGELSNPSDAGSTLEGESCKTEKVKVAAGGFGPPFPDFQSGVLTVRRCRLGCRTRRRGSCLPGIRPPIERNVARVPFRQTPLVGGGVNRNQTDPLPMQAMSPVRRPERATRRGWR